MGGERASTTRKRLAGEICWACGVHIGRADRPGERRCADCNPNSPRHRVLMMFMLRDGWLITFFEADCRTSVCRQMNFSAPQKIVEVAKRGGADLEHEGRSPLDAGIDKVRGGIWLNLTRGQYLKLKRHGP